MVQSRRRRKKRTPLFFVATCAAGLEELVAEEIRSFGGREIEARPSAVSWQDTTLASGYRACLWSRFASRILLELARFDAPDPDGVYRGASTIPWSDHFTVAERFAVSCTLSGARLSHSHYAALRVKDAVVDQFRRLERQRPSVDTVAPDIRLHLHVSGTRANLALDLSGESLHRRGYRQSGGTAPLKESLAAGLAWMAGIRAGMDGSQCILDPMCGSATLLIEAALIIGDSAPGLQRRSFGFMKWRRHSQPLWDKLVQEALELEEQGQRGSWPLLVGSDADPEMVRVARANVAAAGLEDRIQITDCQLAAIRPARDDGIVLTNPPYGERLMEKESVKYLYRALGRILRERFPGWRLTMFSCNPDLISMVGLEWKRKKRLYNGPLSCRLLSGQVEENREKALPRPIVARAAADNRENDLANRLRKNCARLFKWARKNSITCFRLYDADLPEYNFAVDLYEQWIHVQEYAPPTTVDRETAAHRFKTGLEIIGQLLDIPRGRIFIKTRRRQKGKDQYQKQGSHGRLREVREGAAHFLVNLTDYLDTGLFLDHRKTRKRISRLAMGKRFLNLFGYTGSATVSAALGGASETTTVDLSRTYLAWARTNLALNGFGGPHHRLIQADCLQWLREHRARYDLIFVDPPTLSRSRHQGLHFEVQRDHTELLTLAMRLLAPDGVLLFSNNYRKFRLSTKLQHHFSVREITDQTLPLDFRRSRNSHRCWELVQHNLESRNHPAGLTSVSPADLHPKEKSKKTYDTTQ